MTDLDKKLQEIAAMNWQQFVKLVGGKALLNAKICLRQSGKTWGQICNQFDVSLGKAQNSCKKCE